MNVLEHIYTLEKHLNTLEQSADNPSKDAFAAVRSAVDDAKSHDGHATRVIADLSRLDSALASFGALHGGGEKGDAELQALTHEAQAALTRDLSKRRAELMAYVGRKMADDGNTAYVREIRDRDAFGPPVVSDGALQVYVGADGAGDPDDGIDDLTVTCGVWVCIFDRCACVEWECSGNGPRGSFP
ncbi:hypothetical protein [Ruegeria sp. SCP11]|uniref:hypothetical protein n=1 Tax=Ruegeria sp. SCP11 TaxID=3141378 RepID=UPI0033384A33